MRRALRAPMDHVHVQLHAEMIEQLKVITEMVLRDCGFGPQGFSGSLQTMVFGFTGFGRIPNTLSDLIESGISLEGHSHQSKCSAVESYMRDGKQLPPVLQEYTLQ